HFDESRGRDRAWCRCRAPPAAHLLAPPTPERPRSRAHFADGRLVELRSGTSRSESREMRMRDMALVDMHTPELSTAVEFRENLAGIHQPIGIKRAFDALLLREIFLREHFGHEVALFDSHTVLAGQHAANLDAIFENIGAELLGAGQLARLVGVVHDEG